MPRRNESPSSHFEVIRTFKAFQKYIDSFADGKFNLLVVVGRPGISKSESIRRAIDKKKALYCNGGQLTPLQFFIDCFKHRHEPVILDDANEIMKKDIGKRLVMSLTDTRPVKTMDYRTTNKLLEEEGVPTSFQTTSRMCYISNSWLPDSPEANALEDRAHLVWFDPTPKEVHLFTGPWFWCTEIYQYVGNLLHIIDQHSCRIYYHAWELKEAKHDWKKYVLRQCYDTNFRLIQELQDDKECQTEKERVAKFKTITGLSRPTYFNYKKELEAKGQLKPIKPEDIPPDLEPKGAPPPRPEELVPPEDEDVKGEDGKAEDEDAA